MEEDKPIRALFEHCCTVYEAMHRESKEMTLNEEPEGARIYEGHLTRLFQELGVSPPYYTQIRRQLVQMGCIEQLRRGGGNAKSRWLLVRAPAEAAFKAADGITKPPTGRVAMLEQSLRIMQKRVKRVEEALGLPEGV